MSNEWIQFLGILGPLVLFFGFLYRELKDCRSETREEIKEIREEIRQQAARSDQLYQMFIDLIKEKRDRTNP
jgi:cell division protein FtsL